MRVWILSTFPPFRGGIAAFNAAMAAAFEAQGHEVCRVNWSRQYPSLLFPGKSQTEDAPSATPIPPALIDSCAPWSWRSTAQHIATEGAGDLVVVPFWHAFLAPAMTGVLRSLRRITGANCPRFVGLMHNAGSHDGPKFMESLTRRLLGQFDAVWTLSADVAGRIQDIRPNLPVTTLFHPLYTHFPPAPSPSAAKAALGIPPDARCFLFFGLIRPYKGLMRLLEAWGAFAEAHPEAHLLIAGECYGDWSPYAAAIDATGVADRILAQNRFIPDAEVGTFFGCAEAVVLPYERASQSGVTAMALHYGVPVCASEVGGLAEYVRPGKTGELFDPGQTPALLQALHRIAEHDYPEEAFQDARSMFSWRSFAAEALR